MKINSFGALIWYYHFRSKVKFSLHSFTYILIANNANMTASVV
jgi:hypothetical protein